MRHILTGVIFFCIAASCEYSSSGGLKEYSLETHKMGTVFQITALSVSDEEAKKAVDAAYREIDRIEALISSWDEDSETSLINRNAGSQSVEVSEELYNLINRSIKISVLTDGIFDISYASLDAIWKFDGSMLEIPKEEDIQASVALIGYENINMEPEHFSVLLKRKGMKIGFGGIGKGYTANRCKAIMQEMGVEHGVVNAGGDLITWGKQANGDDWTIGIVNPDFAESALSWLSISDMAVVTSGDYERYVEIDGKRYSHIIDPRTGWPAEALKSVTIICPDAEVADALATSVFIMGVEEGLQFVNRIKDVECFIIDQEDNLHHSENISLNYYSK